MRKRILIPGLLLLVAAIVITAAAGCGGGGTSYVTTGGTVQGTVTSILGGPISGAKITIGSLSTTSGSDGSYMITSVPVGTQTITGVLDGYTSYSSTVEVADSETTVKNFEMSPGGGTGNVSGTVTEVSGGTLSGVTVAIGTLSTTTDNSGYYSLTSVPEGSQTITGTKTGYGAYTSSVNVVKDTTVTKNFEMSTGGSGTGTISGTVTSSEGGALSGVTVSCGGVSDTTDGTGSFTLSNVTSGTQTITGTLSGYNTYSGSVTVPSGGTTTKNFEMTPATGTVSGTVTAALGGTLQGVTVTVAGKQTTTGSDGTYTITGLPSGIQSITGTKSGYNNYSSSVQVISNSTTVKNFEMSN